MKIKIIELLNRIANGEEMPEKIKYSGDILKYDEGCQDYMGVSKPASGSLFNYLFVNKATEVFLNDEVEIIEEDKPIESINAYKLLESPYLADLLNQQRYDEFMEHLKQSELEIVDKISKVIDEINNII